MSASNSQRGYGWVAKILHWIIAVLILVAIPLGLYGNSLSEGPNLDIQKVFEVFSIHKTVGMAVLIFGLIRIIWMLTQPKPRPLHPERALETFVADVVHWALYLGMIIMPLTGWLVHSAAPGAFARILWPLGQRIPGIPQDAALSERFAAFHSIGWWALAAVIVLHVAGALKHQIIDRDQTIARMTHGKNLTEPPENDRFTKFTGLMAAIAFWLLVLVGSALAPTEPEGAQEGQAQGAAVTAAAPATMPAPATTTPAPAATPAPAPSPAQETASSSAPVWEVQEGTLGISVQQGSSPVTGQFGDWNANIDYDPETQTGKVDVTINTGSLTLGSVSDTAKGPDFLNTDQFPDAKFEADLLPPAAEGQPHIAKGTLTIAGQTIDAELPFNLSIDGGTAKADGKMSVNRQDFGIGKNYADESTVGFAVEIDFALSAKRL